MGEASGFGDLGTAQHFVVAGITVNLRIPAKLNS